jgi:hypothetical protein
MPPRTVDAADRAKTGARRFDHCPERDFCRAVFGSIALQYVRTG